MISAREAWDSWFDSETVSDDFMTERVQPAEQTRDVM
jgi:antitoxin VapB